MHGSRALEKQDSDMFFEATTKGQKRWLTSATNCPADHCPVATQTDGNRKGLILAACVRAGTKARPLSKSAAVFTAATETAA